VLLQRQGKNPTPPVPACEGQTRYRGPLVLGQIMQPLHVASNFGSFHKNSSAVRLKTKVRTPHPPACQLQSGMPGKRTVAFLFVLHAPKALNSPHPNCLLLVQSSTTTTDCCAKACIPTIRRELRLLLAARRVGKQAPCFVPLIVRKSARGWKGGSKEIFMSAYGAQNVGLSRPRGG